MILWYDSTAKANNFYYLRENYFSCKCDSVIFSMIYWDFVTLNRDWNMVFMALKERKISIKFIILIDFDICLGFSLYYRVYRKVISAVQNCFRLENQQFRICTFISILLRFVRKGISNNFLLKYEYFFWYDYEFYFLRIWFQFFWLWVE